MRCGGPGAGQGRRLILADRGLRFPRFAKAFVRSGVAGIVYRQTMVLRSSGGPARRGSGLSARRGRQLRDSQRHGRSQLDSHLGHVVAARRRPSAICDGVLQEPIQVENGYALVPEAPGLGVEIDEAKLEKLVFDGIWETPQFTRKDGSVTEW